MPSDLAILSAEQYGPAGFHLSGTVGKTKKTHPAHAGHDGPRKRSKTAAVTVVTEVNEDGDEDDKGKRTRGRPRLDTKDQNPADRRRTQIRLAQRAYRSRKENAIQTLEQKVSELQETNEEMSNAFMKLHDYAVGNGIIDMAPDFARQLRSTTEMFLSLARKSSEGGRSESHDIESPGQESGASDKTPPAPNHKPSSPEVVGGQQPTTSEFGSHVLGYNLTTAAEMAIAPPFSLDDLTIPSTQPTSSKITATSHPLTGLDYEIISMPTFDNASFPFDISSDVTFPGFFNGTTATNVSGQPQPSSTTPTYTPPRISPYLSPSLPLPESLAFTEVTFGRRLQRTAIQTGYQLITMANPPKDLFAKIFGFCLLFEPVDKIRDRLGRSLDRTRNENLNYWGAPFWALGGMGQHGLGRAGGDVAGGGGGGGDAAEGCCGPVGNQGTEDVEKHGFNSDFSVGPFDAKTTGVRDRRLGPHMRITLPGFQGDFYDPEEVELYLQGKGVVIRPGQDYVTAEVDTSWFEEDGAAARDPWGDALSGSATIAVDGAGWGMGDAGGGVFGGVTASGDEAGWAAFTGGGAASANANRRKIVTLDVGAFIKEMVLSAVCLGRSPGFRSKDINHAFWVATRSDHILEF